jgi:hypothetical protein
MVLIINGEIIPDSDPRAVAVRRKSSSGANAASPGTARQTGVQTLHSAPSNDPSAGRGGAPPPPNYDEDGPLAPVAQLLNLQGKKLTIPPIPQINYQGTLSIPMINLLASAGAGALLGWRIGLALLVLAFAMSANNTQRGR